MAQVGSDGVTDTFLAALGDAFNTRELLKVKVLDGAPLDARATASEIAGRFPGVQVAQIIGRTVVLYRPFPEDPRLLLTD